MYKFIIIYMFKLYNNCFRMFYVSHIKQNKNNNFFYCVVIACVSVCARVSFILLFSVIFFKFYACIISSGILVNGMGDWGSGCVKIK